MNITYFIFILHLTGKKATVEIKDSISPFGVCQRFISTKCMMNQRLYQILMAPCKYVVLASSIVL